MADLSSAAWTLAAAWALLRYAEVGRLGWGVAGTLLLGISVNVRLGNALFLPLAVVAWLIASQRQTRSVQRLVSHGLALAGAGIAGVAPLLCYHAAEFGNPLASGYGVWVPDRSGVGQAFTLDNLLPNLRYLARDLLQAEWKQTVATFYGSGSGSGGGSGSGSGGGSYFGPVLALLCAALALVRPPRGATLWMGLAATCYGVAMLLYFYQDARFFAPLLPLAAAFVAVRAPEALATGRRLLKCGIASLLLLHVLGVPGSGDWADVGPFLVAPPPSASPRYDLLTRLRQAPPGLLLSAFSVPHAHALLGDPWTVAPARDGHGYWYNPAVWRFGAIERQAGIERARAARRPVYLLADRDFARLRAVSYRPPGTTWQEIHARGAGGIARLAPE